MLLIIDTSNSKIIRLGLFKSANNGDFYNIDTQKGHLEDLLPAIDKLLSDNTITKHEITVIAANVGPGTYTGVRIGVTTANTLAKALDIPIYAFQNEISNDFISEIMNNKTDKFTQPILPVYANTL